MSAEETEWDNDENELPPRRLRMASRADRRQSRWDAFCQHPNERPSAISMSLDSRRTGYVSIWIGTLLDEATFQLYVKEPDDLLDYPEGTQDFCPLWDDLGFQLPHESVKTAFFLTPVAILELVRQLPYIDAFREGLLVACAKQLGDRQNAVVAIYGLDYSGTQSLAFGQLRFVGSFRFC